MPEGIEELVIVENLDGFKTENADNRMVKYLLEISQVTQALSTLHNNKFKFFFAKKEPLPWQNCQILCSQCSLVLQGGL